MKENNLLEKVIKKIEETFPDASITSIHDYAPENKCICFLVYKDTPYSIRDKIQQACYCIDKNTLKIDYLYDWLSDKGYLEYFSPKNASLIWEKKIGDILVYGRND